MIEKADQLLAKEKGTIYKDPGGKISIALVYPNTYSVGMSNLGFQGIYGLLNSFGDIVCERVFLPDETDLEEQEQKGFEPFTLESRRTLARFDIIAFSVSFENDYPHILKILRLARIPARSADRGEGYPLVIMGGVCAFYNPEPLADFFDVCFIGEAEEMLPRFLDICRSARTRAELFQKASGIEGLYVPRFYEVAYDAGAGRITRRTATGGVSEVIRKQTVADISSSVIKPVIMTPEAEFSDMYLLETMRGCVWSCRFCVAGHIYRPARRKSLDALKGEIAGALQGAGRVGLIGPSLSDYPHVEEVLAIEGVDFSITSLRASPRTGRIVGLMQGHKSVSIAPEAGTERLRRVINKKITEDDILETSRMILTGGIETLRLYFMVGLPTETRDDITGIVDLVKKIRELSRKGFLTLSLSTFVPKPFTPFQWHPMESAREVKERLRMVKKGLSQVKGVRVFHDVPKYAYIQGLLALGDRRVSAVVEELAYGSAPSGWASSMPDRDFYIFRAKGYDEILPWDFIDAGVPKEKLWQEYAEAMGI